MVQKRINTTIRRAQIIRAAQRLIIKYGSENVTVRRIAKEIGVSEGAIYRHFKSKRDVLSLLIDNIEDTLLAEFELDSNTGGLYTLETLEAVMTRHMSSIIQRRGTSFQVMAEIVSLGDKKLNKKVHSVISAYISTIKDILFEWAEAGAIRQDINLEAVATIFFGMIQGSVNVWTLSQYSSNLQQTFTSLWLALRETIIKH